MAAAPAKSLCRCLGYFRREPWREEAAGKRVGRLAQAVSMNAGLAEEDFVVAAPTAAAERERAEYEREAAEFDAAARRWRIAAKAAEAD